ncbi:MAG: hypothetical protein EOO64_00435 [Massilia sp.]|nr:MAG: hypothetical protein EOO64_00435 [Massilia sp.]
MREKKVAEEQIIALGNFCFLSVAENKNIGRKQPSVYINDLVVAPNGAKLLARLSAMKLILMITSSHF